MAELLPKSKLLESKNASAGHFFFTIFYGKIEKERSDKMSENLPTADDIIVAEDNTATAE